MLVYRKDELTAKDEIVTNSATERIMKLTHVKTGMNIEVTYDILKGNNSNSPYKVYKEVEGVYTIYKEFFKNKKTLKENFEEAIAFFEDNIYKELKEEPAKEESPRQDEEQPEPEKYNEVPEIGDIIKVGSQYGIVTDVVESDSGLGQDVITKSLTKEEALGILKNKKNAGIANSLNETDVF